MVPSVIIPADAIFQSTIQSPCSATRDVRSGVIGSRFVALNALGITMRPHPGLRAYTGTKSGIRSIGDRARSHDYAITFAHIVPPSSFILVGSSCWRSGNNGPVSSDAMIPLTLLANLEPQWWAQ